MNMDAAMKAMEDRIANGPPFTFVELFSLGDRIGRASMNASTLYEDADCYRPADRLIQKARKAGRIKLVRVKGVGPVWHPVNPAALSPEQP